MRRDGVAGGRARHPLSAIAGHRRQAAADFQQDLLAEYVLARSAHGVTDATVRGDLAAVEEFLRLGRVLGVGGDLAAR